MRKRNEDWCDGECISIGQEKNEARMKLLNRNTVQNRELYKQKRKEAYRLYRRKKRKKFQFCASVHHSISQMNHL